MRYFLIRRTIEIVLQEMWEDYDWDHLTFAEIRQIVEDEAKARVDEVLGKEKK